MQTIDENLAGDVSCLWVLQGNHAARKFYEAHGWQADGRERPAFGAVEMLYCRPGSVLG